MNNIDKELARRVRRIRDRLHTANIINSMVLGLASALCLGILLSLASRFIPVYNVYGNVLKICAASLLLAFFYTAFRTPGNTYAALKADSLGLQERTVTALELAGDSSALAELEKKDTLEHLKLLDYKRSISLKPDIRYLLGCIILAAVLFASGFMPNPMASKAEELHKLKSAIAEQQKKADKLAEQVKNNPKLSEEQKKELEKLLSELKTELKASKDEKEISKALGRTEKKLEYIKEKYMHGDDLNKIAEVFSKNEMTRALADMIKNNDSKALNDNIRQMADKLKQLSQEEKQNLARELSKLAKELKNNPELSKAFAQLSDKLASGELGDISGELNQLDKSVSELLKDENIREAASELAKELGEARNGMNSGQQGSQAQAGQADNGHQGQGNAPGNNGQSGQGNRPGGNGQGAGQGSGAGSGTGMGNEDQEPIQPVGSGIGRKDSSGKKTGEYEKVFTPETLGGEGETSNLSGTKGATGTTEQVTTDKSNTVRGSSVPYDQVVGEYKDKAMESINTSDIPPGMKDMVKEYFTELEE